MSNNRFLSTLGAELRAARKAAGFIQANMAARVGCSLPTVRQAEQGGGMLKGFLRLADMLEQEVAGRAYPQGTA